MVQHGSLEEVLGSIRSHRRFLITSHLRPDGDAVGSILGMRMLLHGLGKHTQSILVDPVPVLYRALPGIECIRPLEDLVEEFDAAVVLECDSVERTGVEALRGRPIINIDHHASAKLFGDVNWVDASASAVAELVYRLAVAANVPVSPALATCLYAAVLTDTGSFCYEGVSDRTFALAENLVRDGAQPARIAERIYFSNPESKIRLLGTALGTLQVDHGIATVSITLEDMARVSAVEADCEGVVNYAIGIDGVRIAMFLREMEGGRFRVSLRSKGALDVARVAERLGGGGHQNASGCTVAGPLTAAMNTLLGQVRPLL